jgi:hypothetical protein
MNLDAIPKRKSSNSFYIERWGDGMFKGITSKISCANRRKDDGDRMFRGLENPKNLKAMKSLG